MWKLMLLILSIALAGCQSIQTTRALGSLQAEYGDLVRTEAKCQSESKASDACLSDFPALYTSIEIQVAEAVEARPDKQTMNEQQITIALYRLAAYAALKAKSGNAAHYGDSGKQLCDKVQVKPPRDCALLEVVGQYEVVNKYAADVNCLRAREAALRKNAAEEPDVRIPSCEMSFDKAANDFCGNVYKPLLDKTMQAKDTHLLADSVVAYLDAQPPRAVESQKALASELTSGLTFDEKPKKPCECIKLDRSDPEFNRLCGNVTREPMATFKAECVRRALEKDSEECSVNW